VELPAIPSLRFDNRTGFDALHFDTIDQNGVAFHVVVAKAGYTLGACDAKGIAPLVPLAQRASLHVTDKHHEDDGEKSVRYENDLAPYKPLCDVVVVGDAHPPAGASGTSFDVKLHVRLPDQPAPLPEKPQALNPMMPLSPAVQQDWQRRVTAAKQTVHPGETLIDKTLRVSGERWLQRLGVPVRWVQSAAAACTLGTSKPTPWRLSAAKPATRIPLRYEYAFGGECRVDTDSPYADKVPAKFRLDATQTANYPPPATAPVAHESCQANPVGIGFTRTWFLQASGIDSLPAPRIEDPAAPFTAKAFWQAACGTASLPTAGMGYVGRGWLPRRELIGTVDMQRKWGDDEVPLLPKDFDFRYWNGAPADQQCRYLEGGEQFTLTNLCAADAPYAKTDRQGNRVLAFTLPLQALFLLGVDTANAVAAMPLAIDTVVIDLDAGQVELTWRIAVQADGDFQEVRLLHANTPEALERLKAVQAAAETAETEPQG
jgi:hypothetical protein